MSTKVSIADTQEWELFQRMWDTDLIHIRAEMRVDKGGHNDLLSEEAPRDIEIVLPKKWLRELVAGLDEYESRQREVTEIVDRSRKGNAS